MFQKMLLPPPLSNCCIDININEYKMHVMLIKILKTNNFKILPK